MNRNQFDEVIESLKNDQPDQKTASEAAERVRRSLFGVAGVLQVAGRIQSCDDYRGLIPGYLQRTLSDARRMLLDDHVRECVHGAPLIPNWTHTMGDAANKNVKPQA